MEATEVSIKNILRCREFPVVVVKPYTINAIFTGCDVYKTVWTPCIEEGLCGVMESRNLMDNKYAVAVQRNDGYVIGHLPLGKPEKSAKTRFYFYKADKKHYFRITVLGKSVSTTDGLKMKVHCRLLLLSAEEKYVLKEKLSMLL